MLKRLKKVGFTGTRKRAELYSYEAVDMYGDNTRVGSITSLPTRQNGGSLLDKTHADALFAVTGATIAAAMEGAKQGLPSGSRGVFTGALQGAIKGATISATAVCGSCHRPGRK